MSVTGELKEKLLATDETAGMNGFLWAPNGQRAIYLRTEKSGDSFLTSNLNGGSTSVIFTPTESQNLVDILWLSDGRLLYLLRRPGAGLLEACGDYWTVHVDSDTGRFVDKPVQLTNRVDLCTGNTSVTSDGKRMAFLKRTSRMVSYIADLADGGTRIVNPRHFPLSESSDGLGGWTPDSKTILLLSDRSGDYGIYKQPLDSVTPEGPLIYPTQGTRNARFTPDGKWIVFFGYGKNGALPASQPEPVLSIPSSGGVPKQLFVSATFSLIGCGVLASAGMRHCRTCAGPDANHLFAH
jgi:Tol biopolymer transport system component